MPELPEVESVCKRMRKLLVGHKITSVKAYPDTIVFKGAPTESIESHLKGETVKEIGRRGKYFWLTLESGASLIGHLGMSGWVETPEKDAETPRFTKLALETAKGNVYITDKRRLGRIWLTQNPEKDPTIAKLGFDAHKDLPKPAEFNKLIGHRKAPIKAVLLDQGALAGIGNYLADEILYAAKIAPQRHANELSEKELTHLRQAIVKIVGLAVEVEADETRFPDTWLFHVRWGGKKGAGSIGKHAIVRETVAGRTTAWVPEVQK